MLSILEPAGQALLAPPPRVDLVRCVLCGACVVACPEGAIRLAPDAFGKASVARVDDARCTRCATCEESCRRRPSDQA